MAIKLTEEDKIFQWASSFYLTEMMDDHIVIGDDETMIAWIDDHKIEANEYQDSGYILNDIDELAHSATSFFNSMYMDNHHD
jgi:hypothetical protein|tara:strand:- start:594 stop:839 length:246 start_codon:yes stop_codon:yes gene_type:complete